MFFNRFPQWTRPRKVCKITILPTTCLFRVSGWKSHHQLKMWQYILYLFSLLCCGCIWINIDLRDLSQLVAMVLVVQIFWWSLWTWLKKNRYNFKLYFPVMLWAVLDFSGRCFFRHFWKLIVKLGADRKVSIIFKKLWPKPLSMTVQIVKHFNVLCHHAID